MLVEAVQVVPVVVEDSIVSRSASSSSTVLSAEVVLVTVQVVPRALLGRIVSRSARGGSKGSTSGSCGQYCQWKW